MGYDPVGGSFRRISCIVDVDLAFFSKLRRAYVQATGNKIVPALNFLSFCLFVFGGIAGLIVVALSELWKYT